VEPTRINKVLAGPVEAGGRLPGNPREDEYDARASILNPE
jgi:hypothetical protein